jgi:hypothetical protein
MSIPTILVYADYSLDQRNNPLITADEEEAVVYCRFILQELAIDINIVHQYDCTVGYGRIQPGNYGKTG